MAGRYQSQPFMGQQSGHLQTQGEQWQPPGSHQQQQQWQAQDTAAQLQQTMQSTQSLDHEVRETKPKTLRFKVCGMSERIAWRVFWGLLFLSALFFLCAWLANNSKASDKEKPKSYGSTASTAPAPPSEAQAVGMTAGDVTSACRVNPSTYPELAQCKSLLPYWQAEMSRATGTGGGCFIDANTGVMNCSSQDSCAGGSLQPMSRPGNQFIYPCADKCGNDASLFASCCKVCETQRNMDLADGQYGVDCQGCTASVSAMSAPDCTFVNGTFKCAVQAECQAGEPLSFKKPQPCNVLPCDTCSDGIMQATCCAKCLENKCAVGTSLRTVCQGCEMAASTTTTMLLVAKDMEDQKDVGPPLLAYFFDVLAFIALVAALIILWLLCQKPKGVRPPMRGTSQDTGSKASRESEQTPMLSTKWRSTIVGPSGEVLESTNWNQGEPPEGVQNVVHVPYSLQPPVSMVAPPTSMLQAQQPMMPPTSFTQSQQPVVPPTSMLQQQAYSHQASGQQPYMPFGQQPYMQQAQQASGSHLF